MEPESRRDEELEFAALLAESFPEQSAVRGHYEGILNLGEYLERREDEDFWNYSAWG